MFSGQSPFLQALGWAVLNSLWQMALLWLFYVVISKSFKGMTPSLKASLATAGMISGFCWFLFTLLNGWLTNTVMDYKIPTSSIWPFSDWLQMILPYASWAYLLMLVFPLRHFTRNLRYVNHIRSNGLSKIGVEWRIFTRNTAAQMGIRKSVSIWISEFVKSPVTIGYLKPVILIPVSAVTQLSPVMMEAVILHELSHIRRYDYLLNLFMRFIHTILYFNPFITAFLHVTEQEREKDCDDMVMQFRYDATGYATALLLLEKANQRTASLTLPVTGRGHELLNRVERILGVYQHSVLFNYRRVAGVICGLICLIGLNIVLRMTLTGNGSAAVSRFAGKVSVIRSAPLQSFASNNLPERNHMSLVNHPDGPVPADDKHSTASITSIPGLIQAGLMQTVKPELVRSQEIQVEKALADSRRVLENLQWKVAEQKMAEIFTQDEKSTLKKKYLEQVSKFDWNKWEDKLKNAYNQVDWDRINSQLEAAVNHIRIDSLKTVYNLAASRLDEVSNYMQETQAKGIPDTDISLKEVEKKKFEVDKMLKELKRVRNKKIVHL